MKPSHLAVIVLAAGKGTRMKSRLPKVMHRIAGRTLLGHVLDQVSRLKPNRVVVVVGGGMESVIAEAQPHDIAVQHQQLGTGHAVGSAKSVLKGHRGDVLVLYGDAPLIEHSTLKRLIARRRKTDAPSIVVLGMRPDDPSHYGRLVLGQDGGLERIVEAKDATSEELQITLCNSGVMIADAKYLWKWISRLGNDNAKGEYYLTDIVGLARKGNRRAAVIEAPAEELLAVNSRAELAEAEAVYQSRRRRQVMAEGVTLIDPESVHFSHDTRLGRDVVIGQSVIFGPGVTIKDDVTIRPFTHIEDASIGKGAVVGPYARIRGRTVVGEGARVGNFVEIKNTKLGRGAKANHLTYLGDTEVGAKTNIGAGTITCNYDGFEKSRTVIAEDAFIGSNTALVAPVKIGKGAIVAAGSVITKDVGPDALVIARGQQIEKAGWASRYRARKRKSAKPRNGKR